MLIKTQKWLDYSIYNEFTQGTFIQRLTWDKGSRETTQMSGSVVQLPDPDLLTFSNNKSPKDQNLTYFLNLQHPFFSVSSIRPEQNRKKGIWART